MVFKHTATSFLILMCLPVLSACTSNSPGNKKLAAEPEHATKQHPERYAMVIGLKPEKIEFYKKWHSNVSKSLLDKISKAHIQNYSIHMIELKPGKYYLFSHFEYTGDDFEAEMKTYGEDIEAQQAWKETDPCQYPIATAQEGDKWTKMEEVFYHP